jgi:hypothetical protein
MDRNAIHQKRLTDRQALGRNNCVLYALDYLYAYGKTTWDGVQPQEVVIGLILMRDLQIDLRTGNTVVAMIGVKSLPACF